MLCVKVFWPDGQPITRSFSKNEVLIGRKSTNDIILAGQDVSGTHACLQIENGCVTLVDLGSTNGTFVNSERVQVSAQLAPADEIKISVFTLHVSLGDEQSAAPPLAGGWDAQRNTPPPPEPRPGISLPPPPVRRAPTGPLTPVPPLTPTPELHDPRRAPTGPITPVSIEAPPPVVPARRGPTGAYPSVPEPPPPIVPLTPAPIASRRPLDDFDAPPIARPVQPHTPTPAPPAWPDEPAPISDDGPPLIPRGRTMVARSASQDTPRDIPPPIAAASQDPSHDLAQAWADPTVRRIVITGLQRIEVERDGVCLPLAEGFASIDELRVRLAALCGRPVLREVPTECVLADGTAVQAILDGDCGPQVIVTRPRRRRPGTPETLEMDRALPPLASELLAACTRAKLPVLIVARPGALAAPLLAALLGGVQGPAALVRGLPTPVVAPRGCTAVDAGHGGGHMAAAVRLMLATDAAWLAVDEPEAAALDECAWAHAEGRGLLVGVRAESLEHALQRARSVGAGAAPTIAYALAVVLGADSPSPVAGERAEAQDGARGSFQVARIVELRRDELGPSIHEIFGPGRRGELQPIAAPALLGELARRGVHLAPDPFTRS